ncbi:MAG: tyrosine-type recombinase/integrase [Bacteroidetes bacterium]|nr:tyrosine-type recombinase/integrase [Bacteroidota bacterium]MBU1115026.1 tyrosine-type recombinase/integrase [Bacteroidota bacterium]MBU1799518.1 tyrosine-type recombinase/integrase [Bacteroidota bacterium]
MQILEGVNNEMLMQLLQHISGANQSVAYVSLRKFIDDYLDFVKQNRSAKYYISHTVSFKHLIGYFQEQKIMSTITFRETELFMTKLQNSMGEGYRVYYRNLKTAFNKGVDWGYISVNPFLKIKLPKKQKNHPEFITKKGLDEILKNIDVKVVRDVSSLGFFTGCRIGELINLRWSSVNLAERFIVIGDDSFKTKTREQRTIPLCDDAIDILIAARGKVVKLDGFVFNKRGSAYTADYISKRFKRACRKAKVSEGIHFHSLRHSFASNLAQREVSLYKIKELLGHSSITTTEIYAHLNIDGLRDAVNVFNERQENSTLIERKELIRTDRAKKPPSVPLKRGKLLEEGLSVICCH